MKIIIDLDPQTQHYNWKLCDGPDGIDEYDGVAISLGECFEEIVKHQTLNSLNYTIN